MKKYISIFISVIISVLMTVPASAQGLQLPERSGDYLYRILADETAEITYYYENETEIVIPETIDGYKVTVIGNQTFRNRDNLTKAVLPEGIVKIGFKAFEGCENLAEINIPVSLTHFGNWSFANCTSLKSITIPSGVTRLGRGTFSGCKSLANVEIPDSVTEIGNYAFSHCDSIVEITIPSGVTRIGFRAFDYCNNLTSVILSDSITYVSARAFSFCENLKSVKLPRELNFINRGTFRGCKSLTDIELPQSIINIGSQAFTDCKSLTEINLPDKSIGLGFRTFYNCGDIDGVVIPDTMIYGIRWQALGFYYDQDSKKIQKIKGFTLSGSSDNKSAQKYAYNHGFAYKDIETGKYLMPEKVDDITVKARKNGIKVSWEKVKGARKYRVKYSYDRNMKGAKTATVKKTEFSLSGLPSGKNVYVRIQTVNGKSKSKFSKRDSVKAK